MVGNKPALHSLPTMHHHTPPVWCFCDLHTAVSICQVAPEGQQLMHLQVRGGRNSLRIVSTQDSAPLCTTTHTTCTLAQHTCLSCVPVAGSAHQCTAKVATGSAGRPRASSSSSWSSASSLCREMRWPPSDVKPKRAWLEQGANK